MSRDPFSPLTGDLELECHDMVYLADANAAIEQDRKLMDAACVMLNRATRVVSLLTMAQSFSSRPPEWLKRYSAESLEYQRSMEAFIKAGGKISEYP